MSAPVVFTEEEAELVILALDWFKRTKLDEYDDESRVLVRSELNIATAKLRDA